MKTKGNVAMLFRTDLWAEDISKKKKNGEIQIKSAAYLIISY